MPCARHLRAQGRLLRAAADEQYLEVPSRRREARDGIDQQVESLVGVERPGESDHRRVAESELPAQCGVARPAERERREVDGVGDHGDAIRRHAAPDDLAAQALADRGHVVDACQCPAFERPRDAVAGAALARGAVVDRGILPERAQLVDDRQPRLAGNAQRRDRIQHRRMGVDHVRPERFGELGDAALGRRHLAEIARTRHLVQRGRIEAGAVEAPAVGVLEVRTPDCCRGVVTCTVSQPSARCSRRIAAVRNA